MAHSPLFLGLDASTQALKASLLSVNLDVISELAVNFDTDLSHYGTRGGVLHGPDGSGEVFSPVLMVVEAFDLLFERIREAKWDVTAIGGVAAAGQQHASVYWSRTSPSILSSIDPSLPLSPQLQEAFSRPIMPNWQDSSTTPECRLIEKAVGGPAALADLTGSKAHERFTGPQIMRFKRFFPEAYDQTHRISLCSSFITTLLCLDGEVKGMDESDACGMNIWMMKTAERGWNEKVLGAMAGEKGVGELERKLGKVETDAGRVVGKIGRWFVDRFGFNPDCSVFPGTGDNPATFLSLTLRESEGLVSLGTSDVVLVSTSSYNPHPEYHAFFHPAQIGPPSSQDEAQREGSEVMRYFNMLVYKNGSLARQHVRDVYFDESWDTFNAAVEKLRPKSDADPPSQCAFWWLLPDIIPDGARGIHKYITDPSTSMPTPSSAEKVDHFTPKEAEALAILESQLLNYRSRSSAILTSSTQSSSSSPSQTQKETLPRLKKVYATGGASANPTILSLMADILDARICKNVEHVDGEWRDADWNSCSVGMAYKARWGWERSQAGDGEGRTVRFDDVVEGCRDRRRGLRSGVGEGKGGSDGASREPGGSRGGGVDLEEEGIRVVAFPGKGAGAYEKRVGWWREMEKRALEEMKTSGK